MLLSLLPVLAAFTACITAYPSRGHYPFAVALCNYADRQSQPMTTDKARQFFTSAGATTPGMYKYIREQSQNAVDFEGTIVGGWYRLAENFATVRAWTRPQRIAACRSAAVAGGLAIPNTHKFIALYNELEDIGSVSGANGGVILIGDSSLSVSLTAHEMLHALGQVHSQKASQTGPPTEYGDHFDVMSTMSVASMYYDGVYERNGPNLCAPARERMGWLPMNRIQSYFANTDRASLELVSLSEPALFNGLLMARVPIYKPNAADPRSYYTVEFRTMKGFDQGFSGLRPDQNGIVIHRVNEVDQAKFIHYPRFPTPTKPFSDFYRPGDSFVDTAGWVNITVLSMDLVAGKAKLEITTPGHEMYGPNYCPWPQVWREGDQLDYTCVSLDRRNKVAQDNVLGPSRKNTNDIYCKPGFVWREAWPKDYVCVEPAERTLAQSETRGAYGKIANDYGSKATASGPLAPVIP